VTAQSPSIRPRTLLMRFKAILQYVNEVCLKCTGAAVWLLAMSLSGVVFLACGSGLVGMSCSGRTLRCRQRESEGAALRSPMLG